MVVTVAAGAGLLALRDETRQSEVVDVGAVGEHDQVAAALPGLQGGEQIGVVVEQIVPPPPPDARCDTLPSRDLARPLLPS